MKKILSPYNMLDDLDLNDKIGFEASEYLPSYRSENNTIPLEWEFKDDSVSEIKIKEKGMRWNISENGLDLERTVKLAHPELLFGEAGVSSDGATLGIGAICISPVSDRLEAFRIGTVTGSSTSEWNYSLHFSEGRYRGNITVKTVLYVINEPDSSGHYPTQPGTLIGILDEYEIDPFDNRTMFPVLEEDSDSEAPWWVWCNWSDIEIDPFTSEFIAIVINKSSPVYPQLHAENSEKFNPALLAETLSAAIGTIIEKVRDSENQWNRIMSDATFAEGTIAYMIQYMRTTFEWDFSSPEKTAKTIREYVYSMVMP